MHALTHLDKTQHGTQEFPAEYYYVDSHHPRYQMPFHWHNEWEILRVLDGTFQIYIDNEQYLANTGDIVLIRGGVLHGGIPSNCIYECFVFDLYGLFRGMDIVKKSIRPFYRQTLIPRNFYLGGTDPTIEQIVDELMDSWKKAERRDLRELSTVGCLIRLYSRILQHNYIETTERSNHKNQRTDQIKSVLEYIEANYSSDISLADLSQVAGMNSKYFCRVFRSIAHLSPIDYVNFYRIEQAAFLLESSDFSVTDIGSKCGFSESSYFTKVFKKYKHVTPREYRRNASISL